MGIIFVHGAVKVPCRPFPEYPDNLTICFRRLGCLMAAKDSLRLMAHSHVLGQITKLAENTPSARVSIWLLNVLLSLCV